MTFTAKGVEGTSKLWTLITSPASLRYSKASFPEFFAPLPWIFETIYLLFSFPKNDGINEKAFLILETSLGIKSGSLFFPLRLPKSLFKFNKMKKSREFYSDSGKKSREFWNYNVPKFT